MKQKADPRFGLDTRNTDYAVVPMCQDRQSAVRFELDTRRVKMIAPKLLHNHIPIRINSAGIAAHVKHRRTVK